VNIGGYQGAIPGHGGGGAGGGVWQEQT